MKTTMPRLLCTLYLALCFTASLHAENAPKFVELKGHTGLVDFAAFSPDGKKIVTASEDGVRIWDAESGTELLKLEGHFAALSPDEKQIATHIDDNETRVWNAESGKELLELEGLLVAFFSNKKKCVTIGDDGTRIWDAESGKELLKLEGLFLAFSPDERKIVTRGDNDSDVYWDTWIWDAESGKNLQKLEGSFGAFFPDGKKLAAICGNIVRIWDAESGKELQKLEGTFGRLSPDGKKVSTVNEDDGVIRIWDAESGKELQKLKGSYDWYHSNIFSPDSKKIVAFHAVEKLEDGPIRIWDAESGEELQKLGFSMAFWEAHWYFSPNGKKILTLTIDRGSIPWDTETILWDVESGKELLKLKGHFGAFSLDGKKLVTGNVNVDKDNTIVRIWDLSEEETVKSPLDLPPDPNEEAELAALREKILAEERAKELALIEEERKIVPLVDAPETLIPLDPQDRIWITQDRKSVVLLGRVVLREGFLELLACRIRTKEHESILAVRVKPFLIHGALLATNARQGKPAQYTPTFSPATGDKINITLRWKDETGTQHEASAQDWVWDMSSPEHAKKPMTTHWVFSGSREYRDDEGTVRYAADETGELFGLSNFVGSILDVPIESSADNTKLQFGCFTEQIPPMDTSVTIVLTPRR